MNKVLFSHSYFLRFDPKQWRIMQPYPPLGTLYAAAVLREAGYETRLWDPMFADSPELVKPELEKFKPDAFVIYDDGFNYLTKMCLTNMREAAFRMIQIAKVMNIPVFICSSDSSDHFEMYLEKGAIAVIRGEGEITLRDTLNNWFESGTEQFASTEGIAFERNGKINANHPREVMHDLDSIPFPAWDLVNIETYRSRWLKKHGYFSLNMSTTRGCPYKCNWCAKPIYGNRYNSRSPEHVVEEIKFLSENYKHDHIWFCDDIFGLKPGWIRKFSELVAQENIRIRYKIQSRVDLLLQENNIESLASSGCDTVWVGAESGSQAVLDAMDKGTNTRQIIEATRLLKKHGIKPAFFLQFGYPGETLDDIRQTINMVESLLPEEIGISVSYPLPGTLFYERVKEQLKMKSNWTDSDDLALMFSNTFPPEFYRHLHRYTHKRYRIRQGIRELRSVLSFNLPVAVRRIATVPYHLPGLLVHGHKMKAIIKRIPKHDDPAQVNSEKNIHAFNHTAPNYDRDFTYTDSGNLQRGQVHKFLDSIIEPELYPRVLEINGGTGEDALWFARKGHRVWYTDGSQEMVSEAKQKFSLSDLPVVPDATSLSFSQLDELPKEQFDLVFSDFGGLNCIDPYALKETLLQVSKRLRTGGKFIAVLMGRKCLTERFYFFLKNNRQASMRRRSSGPVMANVDGHEVKTWYYSPFEIKSMAESVFRHNRSVPIGLFIPPSYLNNKFQSFKTLTTVAGQLEKMTARFSSLSDYADHYLIEFTKP